MGQSDTRHGTMNTVLVVSCVLAVVRGQQFQSFPSTGGQQPQRQPVAPQQQFIFDPRAQQQFQAQPAPQQFRQAPQPQQAAQQFRQPPQPQPAAQQFRQPAQTQPAAQQFRQPQQAAPQLATSAGGPANVADVQIAAEEYVHDTSGDATLSRFQLFQQRKKQEAQG